MLTVFISFAGSHGVTTAAVATTINWPRPALLVEADLSKTSSILPGYFRGQMDHTRGLIPVSIDYQTTARVAPSVLWNNALELAPDRLVIPGFSTAMAGANSSPEFWGEMATVLAGLEASGVDVIVDMGRLALNEPRTALVALADQIVIVSGTQLADATAIRARLPALRNTLSRAGHADHTALLLRVSPTESYDSDEFAKALEIPVLARVAIDPVAAAVFSAGGVTNKHIRGRKTYKTLAGLPASIIAAIEDRREQLGHAPEEKNDNE